MKRITHWITLPVLLCVQCAEPNGPLTQQERGDQLPGLVVSSPVLAEGGATTASNRPIAYVSLPPGILPLFSSVAIRNSTQKGATIDISTIDGGFDPVPIQASVGDRLDVSVVQSNGAPMTFAATVPSRRAPAIVRTNPSRARPNAALNINPTVVFSEPINARTLNTTSFGLYESGVPVAGVVALLPSSPWIAEFTLAGPLKAGTDYELLITRDVRDLEGDELEARTLVEFTSSASIGASGRIAFATETGPGGGYVYVANADGSGVMQLPGERAYYSKPHWSPDGRRVIVSQFHLETLTGGIYVIDVDPPSRITRLTDGFQPAWSPDAKKIAFVAGRMTPTSVGIYVMNADGTGAKRITSPNDPAQCTEGSSANDLKPEWSPDGSRIVFEHQIHTDDSGGFDCGLDGWGYIPQVYVVNADGTGGRRLDSTRSSFDEGMDPAWSPDGRYVAFRSSCCGLALMFADADAPPWPVLKQWTFPGRFQISPAWSSDGKHLVFVNVDPPSNKLFIVELSTGTARPLDVHVPGLILDPSWSPVR
jgi:Tol biopolymer transport system component